MLTKSSATADWPRDALCQSKSRQLPHNKSRTNRSSGVGAVRLINRRVANGHDASTVVDVVNKLDRRRILLTTRSTDFVAKIQKEVPLFLELYQRFLKTQCRIGGKTYKKKNLWQRQRQIDWQTSLASTGATTMNESVPIQYWHSARSMNWPFPMLIYILSLIHIWRCRRRG